MQPARKNRNSNKQYCIQNYTLYIIITFLLKKTSATKHCPPSYVYYMEYYRNFLFDYSLIGIVKSKFTRRNEIWCRIWEVEDMSKNVRKEQDRTSLSDTGNTSYKCCKWNVNLSTLVERWCRESILPISTGVPWSSNMHMASRE